MISTLRRLRSVTYNYRNISSALYLTGDKAQNTFAFLVPYIDFEERLKNKAQLQESIKSRQLNVNLQDIIKLWDFYNRLGDQKVALELTRSEIGKRIVSLANSGKGADTDVMIDKLKIDIKIVKEDLKNLKEYLYGVEESAALKVLSLPNVLHSKTPRAHEFLVRAFLNKPEGQSECHLQTGNVDYKNPFCCYLKNDAALFELAITNKCTDSLLNSKFIQFSNADFARSVIVEGCGTNYLSETDVFTLEDVHDIKYSEYSRLHLIGGASLCSFMAYFARHSVEETLFPIKLFCCGRKYNPATNEQASLFNVSQETVVEVFVATQDDECHLNREFELITSELISFYDSLGYHYKLVYLPASKLDARESLRLSVQMFSSYLQKYVEVGHVSICDDYVSKRLLFTYSVDKKRRFPKVISGTLASAQKLLACVLEYNNLSKNVLVSEALKKYIY